MDAISVGQNVFCVLRNETVVHYPASTACKTISRGVKKLKLRITIPVNVRVDFKTNRTRFKSRIVRVTKAIQMRIVLISSKTQMELVAVT